MFLRGMTSRFMAYHGMFEQETADGGFKIFVIKRISAMGSRFYEIRVLGYPSVDMERVDAKWDHL